MRRLKHLTVIAGLLLAACSQPNRPIPPGSYYSEFGDERIVVVPTRIYFHVLVDGSPFGADTVHPEKISRREYPYEVLSDGRIYFVVSSNDSTGMDLAIDYRWMWRDGEITRIDLERDEKTTFALRQ